jgi:hypothetical protein
MYSENNGFKYIHQRINNDKRQHYSTLRPPQRLSSSFEYLHQFVSS